MSHLRSSRSGQSQAEVFDLSLSATAHAEEIQNARETWEKDIENDLLKFQLASLLARSYLEEDKRESILYLEHLATTSNEYQRDSLYLLTVVRYVLEDYEDGRACAEELCRIDPDNEQVKNLFLAIKYKHEKALERERESTEWNTAIAVGVGLGVGALALGLSLLLGKRR